MILMQGVIITHANLAHNLELIVTGLKAGPSTVVVSWLPLYHDMGNLCVILRPEQTKLILSVMCNLAFSPPFSCTAQYIS